MIVRQVFAERSPSVRQVFTPGREGRGRESSKAPKPRRIDATVVTTTTVAAAGEFLTSGCQS